MRENFVRNMSKHNVRKHRNVRMIRAAMKGKLDDAEFDEKQTRKLFNLKLKELEIVTKWGVYLMNNLMKL